MYWRGSGNACLRIVCFTVSSPPPPSHSGLSSPPPSTATELRAQFLSDELVFLAVWHDQRERDVLALQLYGGRCLRWDGEDEQLIRTSLGCESRVLYDFAVLLGSWLGAAWPEAVAEER